MFQLNELKRDVFMKFLDMVGRAYIQVRHSEDVRIGQRGFLAEEKEKGLVLVLNDKMKFTWGDMGIEVTLAFGSSVEKCFIPVDDILSVYSPELGAQFTVAPGAEREDTKDSAPADKKADVDNLIEVDFKKGKH